MSITKAPEVHHIYLTRTLWKIT